MARHKGSKNKNSSALPMYFALSTEERVLVLANLIVDRIQADQRNDSHLLKKILGRDYGRTSTSRKRHCSHPRIFC